MEGRGKLLVVLGVLAVVANAVPVFVMLPLDTVNLSGELKNPDGLKSDFARLKQADVDGVMVDMWWGVVEKDIPMAYNWEAYEQLVQMAQDAKLRVQVVMSFHQCGGNVGDDCDIPLPAWVNEIVKANQDMLYTDREGNRNPEYLSLAVDDMELLNGRTPIQAYSDFMQSFSRTFADYLGTTVVEVQVGLGPAGELRYPAYPSAHWAFPGIGEFQCYDRYMLSALKDAASRAGHAEWGNGGPSDAGTYNSNPADTRFFQDGGSFASPYGQFFLSWYSSQLVSHGDKVLAAARSVLGSHQGLGIAAKVAGIHWWYNTASHAAEVTAGYYDVYGRDGYTAIAKMLASHGVSLDFTMLEMTDSDNPNAKSAPEELIKTVFADAVAAGVGHSGENALNRYDQAAYSQILSAAQYGGKTLDSFTYLRYGPTLTQSNNWNTFQLFVNAMHNLNSSTLRRRLLAPQKAVVNARNIAMHRSG